MAAFQRMSFSEVLEDLQSRFIINVPLDELSSVERICFQIEQAHWFYEDFVREVHSSLPSLSLKNFSAHFFKQCPLLVNWEGDHEHAFSTFMEYKVRVPVCGAIILNEKLDKVLLVRGWKSKSGWGFPKGKINKEEPETECAVREVYEETGFDIRSRLQPNDHVERTMKEQRIRLYIIRGVPEDTVFLTQTRKEIGDIRWFPLKDLPGYTNADIYTGASKFYMVTAFVASLKKWIHKYKRSKKGAKDAKRPSSKPGLLYVHGGGNAGYKSQTEYESENDGTVSDTNGLLNNQDNEDWGVNTLNQATETLKSLIGIGGSSSSDLVSVSSSVNVVSTATEIYPQRQQPQQHPLQQQFSGHDIQHTPQQQFLPHQMSFPNQTTLFQQQQQNSFFQGGNIPLQGIITTPDGQTTNAMIQILPLPPNQQQQIPGSRSNSTPSAVDVAALQRESLLDLLKGGNISSAVPTNIQQARKQSSGRLELRDVPAPPTVKPSTDLMSDEIRASYGGGGGGPAAKFGLASEQYQPTIKTAQKHSLLNILTNGPESLVSPSSNTIPTPTADSYTQTRTPVQIHLQQQQHQQPDSASQTQFQLERRSSNSRSSIPPHEPTAGSSGNQIALFNLLIQGNQSNALPNLPPATLKLEGGKLKPVHRQPSPSTRKSPIIQNRQEVEEEDDDEDLEVDDFAALSVVQHQHKQQQQPINAGRKIQHQKQQVEKTHSSTGRKQPQVPQNLAVAVQDPWVALSEQQHQQQYQQSSLQSRSQQTQPVKQKKAKSPSRSPAPSPSAAAPTPSTVVMGQNLLDILKAGPNGQQKPASPLLVNLPPPPHHQHVPQQQPAVNSNGLSLMEFLNKGNNQQHTPPPNQFQQYQQSVHVQQPVQQQQTQQQPSLMDILNSGGSGGGGGGPVAGFSRPQLQQPQLTYQQSFPSNNPSNALLDLLKGGTSGSGSFQGQGNVEFGSGLSSGGGGGGGVGQGFFSMQQQQQQQQQGLGSGSASDSDALRSILGLHKK
ncbi:UNVERIFIED_CONTAM: mRNA-decapping enzyme subunit 2 [Siphonaria sp. JEL0065]|nr:mRNA-decapping enzyme subunit 2 [Siphonaria sp. JEL0065]